MGNKSNRTHRETLDEKVAGALLARPYPGRDGGVSCWDALAEASDALAKAVKTCRAVLQDNPLTEIAAQAIAKDIGRRGTPTLAIMDDGTVVLEVIYGQDESDKADEDDEKREWHSNMPTISVLRERAEELGIDPGPYGRRKKELLQAIRDADRDADRDAEREKPKPEPEPKPEPAPQELEPPETGSEVEEDIPEGVKVLLASRKNRPTRNRPKKSLEEVAAVAESWDIDELLGADEEDDE